MKLDRRNFLRNAALAGGAITTRSLIGNGQPPARSGLLPESAASSDSAAIRQAFQSPPKKYRPLARWWWPGNDVTEPELRREIEMLDNAGFGGAEIQAFVKGFRTEDLSEAQRERVDSYASPSFFRHVGIAADEARKRGMFIDYTFGSGWPFGGGEAITPEFASVELRSTHLSIEGPAKFRQQLHLPSIFNGDPSHPADRLNALPHGWPERMKQRTRVVAVVATRGEDAQWDFNLGNARQRTVVNTGRLEADTAVDLTSHLQTDGTLDWDVPPGTWHIFAFCSVPTLQTLNAVAGEGPQFVLDHLNAAAFAAHAKRVGDAAIPLIGEYFGNGLRAVFCDSLEVLANLFWCDDFLAEFQRRRGYDLTLYLPLLKVRTTTELFGEYADIPVFDVVGIGDQVRHDYRQTVADLVTERFYGEFNRWAHEHNLLARTQAHGSPTDVLRVYGEADIPETENLYDNGCYDFLKMAASAAHVYGRDIVGSESFVWSNALYQSTPEKVKRAADELLTAGVNAIVYHGFPYIRPEIPAPGWSPFSGLLSGCYSSQFNELNPFWPNFAQLNTYIARVQYISQIGTNIAAVALYRNNLVHGANEDPPTPKLNQAIMDAGYNYDHINVRSLLQCAVRDQTLVSAGGASYRALVLPPLDAIDPTLAEKLKDFAVAGLPIFFAGQSPHHADGLLENHNRTRRVQSALRSMHNLRNVQITADTKGVISGLTSHVERNIRFHGDVFPFIQKRIGSLNAFFLRNESDTSRRLDAEFEAEGTPELWDPWTGQTMAFASYRRQENLVRLNADLNPLSSVLIVFDPASAVPHGITAPAARVVKRTVEIGNNGWKLTATGLFSSGGATTTVHRDLPTLIDWSLDSELRGFSGRGTYSTMFAISSSNADSRLFLDLGDVRDVAEITVNGKAVATLLLRPYRTDITDFLQEGSNLLEIAVTNALFNSQILREPRTFHPGPTENPSGLMPSGLIGPTQIRVME
jgi:hypothetical protein